VARQALIEKANKEPKFSTRAYTRCHSCGRAKAVYRKFGICRICFRQKALKGHLPGIRKASW
jgi:small subunit ribosomal protein S14